MTIQQAFELALQHHQTGRLAEAEAIYRQILAAEPRHAQTLHLLGVIAYQVGQHNVAVDLILQAIAIAPEQPAFYSNLGEAYRALGRLDEAIAAGRQSIALDFNYAEAHNNLGIALRGKGQLDEAVAAYRQAIVLKPNYPEAHNNLGNALKDQGQLDEAMAAYRRTIALKPNYAEAHSNLGNILKEKGQINEAIGAHRQAIALNPNYAGAHYNLGNALKDQGQLDEAIAAYRRAVALDSNYAEAYSNLGNALYDNDQTGEAIAAYRRAIALKPDFPDPHNNLGHALSEEGHFDEALVGCRRALQHRPEYGGAKFNQALLLLLRGDFEHGWPLYEARWDVLRSPKPAFSQSMWDGSPVDGKRVLIHAEQGFGDSIQFVRYAPLITGRGGEVILKCPRPLAELLQSVKGVSKVISDEDSLPPFDVHVPMLSQPLLFKTVLGNIPREVPYLFADPNRGQIWRERLGPNRSRLRVGLVWTGERQDIRLRKRHVSLEQLLPLLQVKEVDFFSLQMGHGAEEIRQSPSASLIVDHTKHITDFADTAALIMELDLVISVDTAVAHLGGALGRKVWTLLPFVPDWRWGLESEETPWYPTMRLFRQPALGDWESVIHRLTEELIRVVAIGVPDSSGR